MKTEARPPIPKKVRKRVVSRFAGRCGYCGVESARLQVDHITAYYCGGAHDESNFMPACASCNNYKHSFDLEGFRRELSLQVTRAREHSLNFRLAEKFGQIEVKETPVVFFFEKEQK